MTLKEPTRLISSVGAQLQAITSKNTHANNGSASVVMDERRQELGYKRGSRKLVTVGYELTNKHVGRGRIK